MRALCICVWGLSVRMLVRIYGANLLLPATSAAPMSAACQTDSLIRVHGLAIFHAYRTHYNKDCVITDAEWVIFKSCTLGPHWGYFHIGLIETLPTLFHGLKMTKGFNRSFFFLRRWREKEAWIRSDKTDTMYYKCDYTALRVQELMMEEQRGD